jgi:hypothetical protein
VAKELPGVLAELDGDPWISIGVSVRSTTIAAITPAFAIVATAASADRHAVFEAAVKGDRLLVAGHEVSGLLGEHRPGRLAAVLELLQRN